MPTISEWRNMVERLARPEGVMYWSDTVEHWCCNFCGKYAFVEGEKHLASCTWLAARKMLSGAE